MNWLDYTALSLLAIWIIAMLLTSERVVPALGAVSMALILLGRFVDRRRKKAS